MGTIEFSSADFFECGADILVNPVACDGRGITSLSKQFAKRFPLNEDTLKKSSKDNKLKPGRVLSTTEGDMFNAWHIMNAPFTATHSDSITEEQLKAIMSSAAKQCALYKAKSMAVPFASSWKIGEDIFTAAVNNAFDGMKVKILVFKIK